MYGDNREFLGMAIKLAKKVKMVGGELLPIVFIWKTRFDEVSQNEDDHDACAKEACLAVRDEIEGQWYKNQVYFTKTFNDGIGKDIEELEQMI